MKKSIFLALIFCFFTSYNFAQKNQQKADIEAVENNLIPYVPVKGFKTWNLLERMKYYGIQGVSIVAIKNYEIDFAKSYGFADTAKKVKASNETIYSAGSISKLLTAVIVMRLVDEGKLDLDKNVNQYLKSWKIEENDFTKKTPITLRMLLSHTAGASQSSYWGFPATEKNLPSITDILNGNKNAGSNKVVINSEPKKEWRYSGGGYMIVQMVLMDLLNQDFETIAKEYVFKPLGMNNSTFQQPLPASFQQRFSNGYSAASWYTGTPYIYPQQAPAGLHSTATDLAKLIIAIQKSLAKKSKYLSTNSANALIAPQAQISNGGYLEEMGVGAFLLQKADNQGIDGKYFEHQGANAGFIAFAMGSVSNGNGAIIMMNNGDDFNGFGKELRRSIAKTYHWNNFLPKEITPINLDEKTLKAYEGRYRMSANEVTYIKVENNYLVQRINQGREIYCFPIAQDSIVFTDFNIKGKFVRNENGEVIGLQNVYQKTPMLKMKADEFTPNELLNAQRYEEAKVAIKALNLNEYQITYFAYEKSKDLAAAKAILEVALEQHPKSSIVFARWGDYYALQNDKTNALKNYKIALSLQPTDENLQKQIEALEKPAKN
jgi:CubicO group peptidase (beta-lactamase class C family)